MGLHIIRVSPFLFSTYFGGAEGDRTPDLMNAIHALSHLSYGPVIKYYVSTVWNIIDIRVFEYLKLTLRTFQGQMITW